MKKIILIVLVVAILLVAGCVEAEGQIEKKDAVISEKYDCRGDCPEIASFYKIKYPDGTICYVYDGLRAGGMSCRHN